MLHSLPCIADINKGQFFSSDTNRDLASIKNHIRNASGSQVTQSLIVMQIIDLLKTRPVDRVDSMIGSHPM